MAEQPLIENGNLRVKRCRYGLMLYSVNDSFIGRSFDQYGEYCEDEADLYGKLIRPGAIVVDAGANIGAHTLAMSRAAGPNGVVIAFEPQRVVFQMLCANLALNAVRNVQAWQAAVGAERGWLRVPPVDYDRMDNFGGVSLAKEGPGEQVPVVTIDQLDLGRCMLIKADVQGMESEVLNGARRTIEKFKPILYIENDLKEKSPALIGKLFDLGYRAYWHLPRLFSQNNFFGRSEDIFGNVLNVNLLCLPESDARETNLRRVTSPQDWWQDS